MAKGFFQAKGEEIATKMCRTEDCEACLLYKNAQAKLTFAGEGRLGILIVGPSPSAAEEDAKEYFHGRDYEFLKTALESIGISLEDDCYYLSALSCRPPYNRGAKRIEISSCGPRVWRYIQRLKPSVIICLGEDAFDTIIGPRISGRLLGTGYNKFYGNLIPDQELKTHLMVTYSVKELMSKRTYEDGASSKPLYERDKAVYRLWLQHLYDACSAYNKPVEVVDYTRLCKPTQDIDQALEWIEEAMSWPAVAFDYETTGIKPHREGHRIVCASISNGSVSYAFPFFDDDTFQRAWKRLMESSVKKIAHNLSFEYLWTKEICGYWAKNVYWDTMLAAHCLHNLKPVGLKFCTYTEFGVIGYDESADPYLKSSEKDRNEFGDNAFNKIDKAPLADLLLYNALDSLFTYRLYERQMGRLEPFQKEGFDLLMESSLALTETTQYGCILNVERFHEVVGELEKKMDDAARAVMESDEVKLWDKDTEFNFNSPRQIGHLLYDILGIKPPFFTETGAPSTDAEALEKIKIPLVEKILTYRKYMKLLKTYIRQYSVESVDGLIHAWFHLHKVDTFRSCVAKGSKILVARDFIEHPEGIPIEDVQAGDYVYTYDDALQLTLRRVLWAGKTGHKKVVRVHFRGGAHKKNPIGYIDVTPEHLIRTITGEYVEAQHLVGYDTRDRHAPEWRYQPTTRVLSCSRHRDRLIATNQATILEHRLVYSFFTGDTLTTDDVIHHINGNHLDHALSNLQKMTLETHSRLHSETTILLPESKEASRQAAKRGWDSGEYQKYVRYGKDCWNWVSLSRTHCLREFVKARGVIRKIDTVDFSTYKRNCKEQGIDLKAIGIRYNPRGEYLSRWRVQKALCLPKLKEVYASLGIGYYALKRLCAHYNIDVSDRFGKSKYAVSPWASPVSGNHIITRIEWLPEEVDVYDIEVEETHNFIANEICVHNSSAAPNIQNLPKRDDEAKTLITSLIRPRRGHRIISYDYKSLEVLINACHSGDKNLIAYASDPSKDMHRDSAADIFMLDLSAVPKAVRSAIKGAFVFASFYGSYYKQTAPDCWDVAKANDLLPHLAEKGITTYEKFEDRVRIAEEIMWTERFPIHDAWRKEQWKKYQRDGYLDSLTGFRLYGPMSRNNSFNGVVQGDAYHILQWSFNQVLRELKERGMETRPWAEIHDAADFDCAPGEETILDALVYKYFIVEVKKKWPWIVVNLQVEKERSEIDGDWSHMESCGYLTE